MLDFVRLTQPVEVDCDVCLMHVGEFAEAHVVGKPVPEGLKAITEHLELCPECREEFELLRETLVS